MSHDHDQADDEPRPKTYDPPAVIVLTGCLPWPRKRTAGEPCPVCAGKAATDPRRKVICLECHAVSPALGRQIAREAVGLNNTATRTEADQADQAAKRELAKRNPGRLSERDRRRIFKGCRVTDPRTSPPPCNLAKVGREWLKASGQLPDWKLNPDGNRP